MHVESQTVADIVAKRPELAAVFEKRHIDFCCNGQRRLDEVCAEKGLSAESLLAELNATPQAQEATDWLNASTGDLISHIVGTHHVYLRSALPSIAEKLDNVVEAHGAAAAALLEVREVFQALQQELIQHMAKEEMVLFPLAVQIQEASDTGSQAPAAPGGTVRNPIRMMEHEHDNAGEALRRMRQLTGDYAVPAEACNTWRALYAQLEELEADLHMHVHLENNILFPRVAELETVVAGGS